MRARLGTLVSALIVVAGAGIGIWQLVRVIQGSSPSVSKLETSISTELDGQLITQSAINPGAPPTASVSCPQNANLDKGSTFYCDAVITSVNTSTSQPLANPVSTQTERVKVTMQDGGQAQWAVVPGAGG